MGWIGNTLDTCAFESSDAGAFYTGGEGGTAFWNGRGSLLLGNTFRNVRNEGYDGLNDHDHISNQAVYLDDQMSGWTMENNSFHNCQVAMFIGVSCHDIAAIWVAFFSRL